MRTLATVCLAALVWCAAGLAQDSSAPTANPPTSPAQQSPSQPAAQQAPAQTSTPQNPAEPTAQQNPAQPPGQQALKIAPGSVIPVQLTKTVDAKKAKSGDEVQAKVTQDLKAGNGELIVPKDTKVLGHVTDAQPRTKEQKESQVGIAFDHAVMKDGRDVSLPLSIQAIIAPEALNAGNNAGAEGADQAGQTPSTGGQGGYGRGTSAGSQPASAAPASSPSEAPGSPNGAQSQLT